MKMRKLVAVLMAVMMLCCIVPFSAMAAGNSATIDFSDKANRTAYSTSQQVWEQNGITITNDKAGSTSNVGDYGDPARFYKGSALTIEYPGMTAIVFNCDDYKASYVTDLQASIAGADVSVDGTVVTVTLSEAADSFVIETLAAQVRVDSITVYTNGATPEEPSEPEEPETPAGPAMELVTEPDVDIAYKFGMIQGNVSATDVYYLIGGMNSYYLATGTDAAAAIDVYLENADGGYYMYTLIDGVKTYINMVVNGTHVNGAYEAAASTVYTFDADAKTVIADVDGAPYWFGTRNDKTYTTVGPVKVEYAGFYCQFYISSSTPDAPVEPDVPVTPDEPDVPSDPAADSVLTIPQAIELGLSKEANTYTEGKYYVTGKIAAVSNATFGNMYIVDENNNQLMIYGTYSADGEIRYDALEYMPVVGDTITVYGIIGTYNGSAAQMKNGWITEIVKGDGEPENTDPAADSTLTLEEAYNLGLSKLHDVYTVNKYYITVEILEVYNDIYGNMYIKYDDENMFTIYGTYDADGTNRYDAMEVKPVAGDTVTLYGIIGQYNGKPQMKNAWIIEINPTDEPSDPTDPETPDEPSEPSDPETPDEPSEPSEPESPDTGVNTTVYVALAVIMMALAAVVAFVTSKKRA